MENWDFAGQSKTQYFMGWLVLIHTDIVPQVLSSHEMSAWVINGAYRYFVGFLHCARIFRFLSLPCALRLLALGVTHKKDVDEESKKQGNNYLLLKTYLFLSKFLNQPEIFKSSPFHLESDLLGSGSSASGRSTTLNISHSQYDTSVTSKHV